MRFLLLVFKNLRRNKLRTVLTALAVITLVFIFSMIHTVVGFLDSFTEEKHKDVKLLINERFRIFSNFDRRHMENILSPRTELGRELRAIPGFDPDKQTVWHFVLFSLDPDKKDPDKSFFAVATYPEKIRDLTDNLKPEDFDPKWAEWMKSPPKENLANGGLVLGKTRANALKVKEGEKIKALATTHLKGTALREPIEMEFEIVGLIPERSGWNEIGFIDVDYLNRVLQKEKNEYDGKISYGWLQVEDSKSAEAVSSTIERHIRELRCETAATANTRFFESMQGIMWGIKWMLRPAILFVMVMILANTFSLTVRERETEIAVLKVLGFRWGHIFLLVLGEAILVGLLAGLLGAGATYSVVNFSGGIPLPMMPRLMIAPSIFFWAPLIGMGTALAGAVVPAIIACLIRVSNAFARTA